jgi:hypothetical protein
MAIIEEAECTPPIGCRLKMNWPDCSGLVLRTLPKLLRSDAVQFPGFADEFDAAAPAVVRGYSPPWLGITETGMVQVWSGIFARTQPDWSLWIKAPTNLVHAQGIEILEGIVETDQWFGPLFSNFRLLRSDVPFHFPTHHPLLQVTPIHRTTYRDLQFSVGDLATMSARDWADYHRTIVVPQQQDNRQLGGYAVRARKRRAAERAAARAAST